MAHTIKILSWNSNGIYNKINELEVLAVEENIDIIVIQESKLNNRSPPSITNYTALNKTNGQHHGLLMYIKNNIIFTELLINTQDVENQTIIVGDTAITNFYTSPSIIINTNEIHEISQSKNKYIIIGDFNSKHISWNNNRNNRNGNILRNFIDQTNNEIAYPDNNYTHFPSNNNTPSTIDIALIKNINLQEMTVINALDSDHLPVIATLCLKTTKHDPITIAKTDWDKFRSSLNNHIIDNNIHTKTDINSSIKKLTDNINTAFNVSTKQNTISKHSIKLPDNIKTIINTKNRLRRLFQRTGLQNIKQQINQLTREINTYIKSIKTADWENKLRKITPQNPTSMWKIAKALKNKNSKRNIPALSSPQGLTFSDIDKANSLAETFHQIHKQTHELSDRETNSIVENSIQEINRTTTTTPASDLTSPMEIKAIIKNFNANKAPGEDKITNKILKNLPKKSILQIYYILNQCLKLQYFPSNWKNAIVIPFPKPNKNPNHPSNYRPISLLPTISKILEKLILTRIQIHEKAHPILIPEQFGFRSKHSTTLQLARITDRISTNFNLNKTTTLLTLDIEKAFDTVWHNALIHKLYISNIPLHLIKMIKSLLSNRTFQVKVNNSLSIKHSIPYGVIQGGILSPTLFIYYINDIPKTNKTTLALFADDTAVWSESWRKKQNLINIQNHIIVLEKYYDKWKIKINAEKTSLVHFSHKKDAPNYQITYKNHPIQTSSQTKYLGITLDPKLKFKKHVQNISNQAKGVITKLYPLLTHFNPLSTKTKIHIYKAYIRPILMYSSPIFSSASKSNIKKLQVVQNKVLRLILNKSYISRTTTQELHELGRLIYIEQLIDEETNKFYLYKCNQNSLTSNIAKIGPENAPFKIKHKLTHHRIYSM